MPETEPYVIVNLKGGRVGVYRYYRLVKRFANWADARAWVSEQA